MKKWFEHFSIKVSAFTGSPYAFIMAVLMIAVWIVWAAPQKFSGDSQMPVNTITTIITFLMVFLIQCSQNRDTQAIHLKLKELITAVPQARDNIGDVEKLDHEEIQEIIDEKVESKVKEHCEDSKDENVLL